MRAGSQTRFPARKQVASLPDRFAAKPLVTESSNTHSRKISSPEINNSLTREMYQSRTLPLLPRPY